MRDDLLLFSIRESIDSIEEYLRDGRSFFFSDKKTRDAVLRNLHMLSESAQRISVETKRKYPGVAWRDIAGFRNVVVTYYLSLDLSVIWVVRKPISPSRVTPCSCCAQSPSPSTTPCVSA